MLKDKKVLLVGGAGFIGHHLALTLSEMEVDVQIMDSLGVNNISHHAADNAEYASDHTLLPILFQRLDLLRQAHIPIHVGDAGNIHSVEQVFEQVKPDVIVFLAAISHASYSNEKPLFAFENNLRSFHNVMYAARGIANQVVYFSSSMIYGDFETPTVNEMSPTNPKGVYGCFKLMGEQICQLYQRQYGLNYTTIRPSALYGRRCVSRRVSQIFIEKAILGQSLAVEGDGDSRLDFTHIDDLVSGIIATLGNPAAMNETFNITYGSSRSLKDLINILKEYFPDLVVNHKPQIASYVKRGTLSIDKAKSVLGYEPKNDIEVGYRKYIEWSIENEDIIKKNLEVV
jgi:nucleoside-diphosphate-sugar epimerase